MPLSSSLQRTVAIEEVSLYLFDEWIMGELAASVGVLLGIVWNGELAGRRCP